MSNKKKFYKVCTRWPTKKHSDPLSLFSLRSKTLSKAMKSSCCLKLELEVPGLWPSRKKFFKLVLLEAEVQSEVEVIKTF
jgi:hypothetical protein